MAEQRRTEAPSNFISNEISPDGTHNDEHDNGEKVDVVERCEDASVDDGDLAGKHEADKKGHFPKAQRPDEEISRPTVQVEKGMNERAHRL
jgi:hypothetical protein